MLDIISNSFLPMLELSVNNLLGVTVSSRRRAICASVSSPDAIILELSGLLVDTMQNVAHVLASLSSAFLFSLALSLPWLTQYRKSPTSLSDIIVTSSIVIGKLAYRPNLLNKVFCVYLAWKCSLSGLPHTDCAIS